MDELELYVPKLEDLWFRQKMMSNSETMSYNANWDVEGEGYHKDTAFMPISDAALIVYGLERFVSITHRKRIGGIWES